MKNNNEEQDFFINIDQVKDYIDYNKIEDVEVIDLSKETYSREFRDKNNPVKTKTLKKYTNKTGNNVEHFIQNNEENIYNTIKEMKNGTRKSLD